MALLMYFCFLVQHTLPSNYPGIKDRMFRTETVSNYQALLLATPSWGQVFLYKWGYGFLELNLSVTKFYSHKNGKKLAFKIIYWLFQNDTVLKMLLYQGCYTGYCTPKNSISQLFRSLTTGSSHTCVICPACLISTVVLEWTLSVHSTSSLPQYMCTTALWGKIKRIIIKSFSECFHLMTWCFFSASS